MSAKGKKRVTLKSKNPNPLFEQWLTEWRDKAQESGSKMQFCFSLALKSLKQYPLPLETGKDCKLLKGFGEKLCKMLDDKLKQYKNGSLNVIPAPEVLSPQKPEEATKTSTNLKKSLNKEYVPLPGSGAYAILLTLFEKTLQDDFLGYCTKTEIIAYGQSYCNVSFTKPAPGTRYTAWSSMRTLVNKKLVTKEGNPAKFTLTDEGSDLAGKLYVQQRDEIQNKQYVPQAGPSSANILSEKVSSTSSQSSTSNESVILDPHTFQIILLVDTNEVSGAKGDESDPVIMEMKRLNINYEIRNLKVGDYAWICRDLNSDCELVLPYIVERKRMDDFGKSVKDDRFHEQKFRLKQCGIPNLIYLVENYGTNEHVGLPLSTLMQAATNTLVHDGFIVKFTNNPKSTWEYLSCLSSMLENLFKSKTLVSCQKEDLDDFNLYDELVKLMHFKDFNKSSSKTKHFKIKEMFVKQLLQIKGMSVEKALAIVSKYPTPKNLKLTYSQVNQSQGEKLLAGLQFGTLKKNIGPVLSKIVYQFLCDEYK